MTKPPKGPEQHLVELQKLLEDFSRELAKSDLRAKVRSFIPSYEKMRKLGVSLMPDADRVGARDRVLAYFLRYPQTVIDGEELMVVSGIGEWARRLRELRVQFGWSISSGSTFKDIAESGEQNDLDDLKQALGVDPITLRPDQYVLTSTVQDTQAAYRWNVSNEIRKSDLSVRDKLLKYLQANVGNPVTGEELRYLASSRSEWARRIRELRTEYGWTIASRMTGRPDLPVGVYVLESEKQAPVHDRRIPDAVRIEVLDRDNHSCVECGWNHQLLRKGDPRQFIELHHIQHHAHGGENIAVNLLTLCNVHHDQVHSDTDMEARLAAKVSAESNH